NVPFSPTSTHIYTVSATAPNGCSGSATLQVIVYPMPTLTTTASTDSICVGESATLSVSGATSYVWYPGAYNGSVISPAPSVSTIYTVTGQSNGCSETATVSLVVSSCVGIHEKEANHNLRIYPNPTTGVINFEVNGLQSYNVKVFNSLSQLIYSSKINVSQAAIELNIPKGIYFIKVYDENRLVTHKKIVLIN
ncbi:MAG: hypothetical protein K0S26_700, partial [Bacteroidota bacterium]|nr:hypothetical protein [Bacteroidota bacterium]